MNMKDHVKAEAKKAVVANMLATCCLQSDTII